MTDEQLQRIERKLDYIVERQRFVEEFIDEMTPVGREALGVASAWLADLEAQGFFDTGSDAMALGQEVLDVVQNADKLKLIGPMGAMRATSEPEVQRGLAIAVELLRRVGRAQIAGGTGTPVRRVNPSFTTAPAGTVRRPAPTPPPEPACESTVVWEGRTFDAQGFMVNPGEWDEELATKMAVGLDLELTDEHWGVIRWARKDFIDTGSSPNVRRVAIGSGVGVQRMYELFHTSPGKTTALIAGIPKPAGCI